MITKRSKIMLAVMFLGAFVTGLNQTVVAPALPTIMVEMDIDAATGQWLTTGFTLVNAVMIPVTAFLIERFSTRQLFLASMACFTLGSVLCTVGPAFSILLVGRVFQAVGAGVLMPMVMTTLVLLFPVNERGRALGMFGLIISFAPAIGPTLAGIIIDASTWRFMFGIVTLLAVVVIVFAAFSLQNLPHNSHTASLDPLSVTESTLGFGGLLYGFSLIGSQAAFTLAAGISLGVGAVCVVLFFKRQASLSVPMLRVDVFQNKRFLIATVIGMIVQAALLASPILLPIYAQTYRGFSATVSGLLMLPGAIMLAALSPVTGRLFDKYGPRALGIGGGVLLIIGSIGLCFMTVDTHIYTISFWYFLRCCGIAMINMPITTWGVNALDNSLVPHANSLNNTLRQVSSAFGTAIVVSVMTIVAGSGAAAGTAEQGVFGIDIAFAVTAVVNIVAVVLIVWKVRYQPEERAGIVSVSPTSGPNLLRKLIRNDATIIPSSASVREVLTLLYGKHISGAPIIDENSHIVGFVSDGDILRYLSSQQAVWVDTFSLLTYASRDDENIDDAIEHVMQLNIMEIATQGVISIDINTGMRDVCRILGSQHLKKAPVTDNGIYVGMVDRWDIDHYALERYFARHPLNMAA